MKSYLALNEEAESPNPNKIKFEYGGRVDGEGEESDEDEGLKMMLDEAERESWSGEREGGRSATSLNPPPAHQGVQTKFTKPL